MRGERQSETEGQRDRETETEEGGVRGKRWTEPNKMKRRGDWIFIGDRRTDSVRQRD